MRSFKVFLGTLLLSFLVIVGPSVLAANSLPETGSSLVATVNLSDAKILSQSGNIFTISFDLSNEKGIQTGVMYGIQLISEDGKYIADEKVYDESLTLQENSKVTKTITYATPPALSGSYILVLSSNNENNFPFGAISLGKVTVSAMMQDLQVLNGSCYLSVEGDKAGTHYSLLQNVDIGADESLHLTCDTVNRSTNTLTLTPSFETRAYSSFGKVVTQEGGDTRPIAFEGSKNKTISLALPTGTTSSFYSLKLEFEDGTSRSNSVFIRYIVHGPSAVLTNISLDKDAYKRGDSGILSILWSASAGNFSRNSEKNILPVVTLTATITDGDGKNCAPEIKQMLGSSAGSPQTLIPFVVKTACNDPQVVASLTDAAGKILDQKQFSFSTDPAHRVTQSLLSTPFIVLLVVVIFLVLLGIHAKRKKEGVTNQHI